MEDALRAIATWVSWAAEGLAIVVIAVGILRVAWKYATRFALRPSPRLSLDLRLDLGRSLALGLELLLAADIIRTAIAPSWEEIGKLAAIAGIRTALNFFLEHEIERERKQIMADVDTREPGQRDTLARGGTSGHNGDIESRHVVEE